VVGAESQRRSGTTGRLADGATGCGVLGAALRGRAVVGCKG